MKTLFRYGRGTLLVLVILVASTFAFVHSAHASGPISWFATTTVSNNNNPGWGRMLPWDKQGDNLVTYTEYPPNGSPTIKVARSNPSNPAYVEIASIPSPSNHIQEQTQMVQLADGTILMAARDRQTDLHWYGLPIFKSIDGGYHWQFISQLDTNPNGQGRFDRGLWEPFLYVLPNGCVAGFYASEKHADENPSYSQTVSERVSCDAGQSWGPEIFAASQAGNARPGMPGLARMANGQYILVFEVCGIDNCNIHYKFSSDGTSWANGVGTNLANQQSGPYVAVLSTGRILVTSATTNQISVSDNNGQDWYLQDPPAWGSGCCTWPAIYETANHEVGVIVNNGGGIQIKFGNTYGGGGGGGTSNLALNKSASASSEYNGNFSASKALDGDTSTGWSPTGSNGGSWWEVDLGSAHTIAQIQLITRQDIDQPETRHNFEIWASNNADMSQGHVVLGSQGNATLPYQATWSTTVTDATAYRYVAAIKVDSGYFFITELRVLG